MAYDVCIDAVEEIEKYGAKGTSSFLELIKSLEQPRILWIMVPHEIVDLVLSEITPFLSSGDIVIEAGNSHYKDSVRRYNNLKKYGGYFLDVGTLGGLKVHVTELVIWLEEILKLGK
jgi:6-phosphogluconate dehydrogenase